MRCLLFFKRFTKLTLILAAFILMTGQSFALDVNLVAKEFTMTMPDSRVVPMWGFARANNGNCPATDILEGPSVPGPKITVPDTETMLNITLCNELDVPVSIVIPGQIATMTPVWSDDTTGPRTSLSQRVRSFTHETARVMSGTYSLGLYSWSNLKPGTYAYQSGTHPQVQVQMGLYGSVVKDHALNQAYSSLLPFQDSSYDSELLIFISEIDPGLHDAVAGGNYGISPTSTLDYNPQYFLVNGAPYSASSIPVYAGAPAENTLLRFINMGLETHVPVLKKDHMKLIAEDGNEYPYPREQYSAILTARKTMDAIWSPSGEGNFAAYDRRLNLTNAAVGPGGLYINMDVCSNLPAIIADTSTGYPALQSAYDAVANGQTLVNRFDLYNEDAIMDDPVTAYLEAVYDCPYTPSDTVILANGSITVNDGTIIIGRAYYCDEDFDSSYSSTISGVCTGLDCELAFGCQLTPGTDCDDTDLLVNPAAAEVPYNGKDDDCNPATIDDDLDGDGYPIATDCDDTDGAINPVAVEVCDGLDNDCDGTVDNAPTDAGGACSAGVGECAANGVEVCTAGVLVCNAVAGAPTPELCDGLDNDCDGTLDNAPTDAGGACSAGIGECNTAGTEDCTAGVLVCNAVAGAPTPELCDGLDNDCDGTLDNAPTDAGGACSAGIGECNTAGTEDCTAGVLVCNAVAGAPTPELCDGLDNDCDGTLDNAPTDAGGACSAGIGECNTAGTEDCTAGVLVCNAVAGAPTPELCDGLDNDCDGTLDNAPTDAGGACSAGIGECNTAGTEDCTAGVLVCNAVAGAPTPELCDGLDNDCDGTLDNAPTDAGGACSAGIGECNTAGTEDCTAGVLVCNAVAGAPTPELCDGLDNDCDGTLDNAPTDAGGACSAGIGECNTAGTEDCTAGVLVCNAVAGAPTPELCDGLDNDCDGTLDNAPTDAGGACSAGIGECNTAGTEDCTAGVLVCNAVAGAPTPEQCDGLDNDCDGVNDNGLTSPDNTLQDGVCAGSTQTCYGTLGWDDDYSSVTGYEPVEATCDGIDDNDCDGVVDASDPDCGA